MVGGTIVQVVGDAVEVLCERHFDRCWRRVEPDGWTNMRICVGDRLWWQSGQGYLTREGIFTDYPVGRCVACNPHGRPSTVDATGGNSPRVPGDGASDAG